LDSSCRTEKLAKGRDAFVHLHTRLVPPPELFYASLRIDLLFFAWEIPMPRDSMQKELSIRKKNWPHFWGQIEEANLVGEFRKGYASCRPANRARHFGKF
jgi:hypothetical protein